MNENELRELQERALQIRQLQETYGWGLLADYVTARVQGKVKALLAGSAKSMEEYRAEAGWVAGAQFVLQAADELEKRIQTLVS